jgi:ubiquinone/menaquinone biosynthesis C-methylase UbiE
MFGPLADAMLNIVSLDANDRVLDVACGTGIVARKAKERTGPLARVVGADLNEGMIQTAQSLTDPIARSCEWVVAPAEDMPFEKGEFTKVFCQQGLQFFPDQIAALAEMRRVLADDGQIFITIWKEPSPFFTALAASIENHINKSLAEKSLAPFNYGGHGEMQTVLEQVGFSGFVATELTVNRTIYDPKNSIEKEIMGNPIGPAVSEMGQEVMQVVCEDVYTAMNSYIRGSTLVVPQTTCLYQANIG